MRALGFAIVLALGGCWNDSGKASCVPSLRCVSNLVVNDCWGESFPCGVDEACRGAGECTPLCGNGRLDDTETCDSGDGCDPTCQVELPFTCDRPGDVCFDDAGAPLGFQFDAHASLADLDGDGDLDVLAYDRIFPNRGDGVLERDVTAGFPFDPAGATTPSFAGDVDGDGRVDALRVIPAGLQIAYQGGPAVTLSGVTGEVVAVGDFDGVRGPDILLVDTSGLVLVAADGAGGFAPPRTVWPSTDPLRVLAVDDFDRDGALDVVLAPGARALALLRALGDGTFAAASLPYIDTTKQLVALDADGDGALDLAIARGPNVELYRNDGAGHFAMGPTTGVADGRSPILVTGDFDGDGRPDLALLGGNGIILRNIGGAFAVRAYFEGYTARGGAAGDLDGDGRADLVHDGRVLLAR